MVKKFTYSKIFYVLLGLLFLTHQSFAQTTISTAATFLPNNGTGLVTFNFQNTNSSAVIITDVSSVMSTTANCTMKFWYNTTPISAAPGIISTANGWTLAATQTVNPVFGNSTTVEPLMSGLYITIPANTTYAIAISGFVTGSTTGALRYFTITPAGTYTFPGGGCNIITGTGIGYASTSETAAAANTPRGFVGSLTFISALPCVAPPTPGTTLTSATSVCSGGSLALNLSGNSQGTGQTYQWQTSPNTTGPWTNISTAQTSPNYTTTATTNLYYRCAVSCGTSTAYSTAVQVTVPTLFPAGTYTINSASPTAGTNFHSFSDAASAISCGIAGHVVFNVVPGSGPYNEQVTIPDINNNANKTVTFNGNGETLTDTNTSTTNYGIFTLNGTDYVKIKKLVIAPSAAGTSGFGVLMSNDANNNTVDSCTINIPLSVTSSNFVGIAVCGSLTNPTTGGPLCDSITLSNNTITGGYYGITLWAGSSTTALATNNKVINNKIIDNYYMSCYFYYNTNLTVTGNEMSRPTRTTFTSFYGIYCYYGGEGLVISKNKVHTPFGGTPTSTSAAYGIMIYSATGTAANPTVISNNTVYDFVNNGIQYGILNSGSGNANVYYNTINFDNTATTSSTTYGFYNATGATDFKNNIVNITRGGTGSKYCFYRSSGTITSDRNDLYITTQSGVNYTGYYTAAQATLANWQSASSQDANSVAIAPSFTAPVTGNLTPTNLAIDDLGLPVAGVTDDITGYTRSVVMPDMGAFEFNNCNAPTGLAASATTSTHVNLSWNAIPSSLGYEYIIDQNSAYPTTSGTATTALGTVANGLTPLTTYYLHLRTKCSPTNFSDWVILPFKTCVLANITASGTTTFCTGDSVTLAGAISPTSPYIYQWVLNGNVLSPGGNGSSITVTATGTYRLRIQDPVGQCADTTVNATVVTVGAPPTSNITPAGAAGLCLYGSTTLHTNNAPGLIYKWYRNGVIIAGATDSTYVATLTGSYTVRVGSDSTCGSTTAIPTVLSTLPQPPAVVTAGVGAICQNSTLSISANSGTGYTYKWFYNGALITGASSITYNAANAGNYAVAVTDANGCKDTSTAVSLAIVPLPSASISPSAPSTGCDSLVLTANSGTGYTYTWLLNNNTLPNATGIQYMTTLTGSYSVTVKDANNCLKTSTPVSVTINPSPESIITYTTPLVFCEGGAVALNAYTPQGTAGLLYQWLQNGQSISGETTNTTVAATTGSYAVKVTNSYGCIKISSPVVVTVHDAPEPAIYLTNNQLSTDLFVLYQWYLNGQPIPGATNQTYQSLQNGGYYVVIKDNNGCEGISPVKIVNNVGINTTYAQGIDIHISPNPASDHFLVKAPFAVKVVVKDMSGRTVITPAPGENKIQLYDLPSGLYMVTIFDQDNHLIKVEKLTKK